MTSTIETEVSTTPQPLPVDRVHLIIICAALVSIVIVVAATTALGRSGYDALNRGYPGELVSTTSAALRIVAEWAGAVTLGALVHAAFLQPRSGRSRGVIDNARDLAVVRIGATVWAAAAATLIVIDAADANGVALERALSPGGLGYLVDAAYLPKAWMLVALCAFLILCAAWWVRTWTALLPMIALAALAIISPTIIHQVLVGPGHDFAADAATFGTPATALLLGLPVVVAIGARARPGCLPQVSTNRLRVILGVACIIALAAEIVILLFKTVMLQFVETPTGGLTALRILLLIAFGLVAIPTIGHRSDKTAHAPTTRLTPTSLVLLLVLPSVSTALAVVMARIPPPQYFVQTNASDILFGFQTTKAPTLLVLVGDWRPNILMAAVGAVSVAAYLISVTRLRIRGDTWPVGRTIAWILGWTVIVFATSSGFGRYSGPSFSIHMIVHMALNMLGPVLLVMGGVVTLLLRALDPASRQAPSGPHEWLVDVLASGPARFVSNPILVFLVFVGSYYALYLSPLFEEAMRSHWSHQLMNLHFVITGYLFYALIIGVDRPSKPLPHLGKLGFVLAAMPFHAFFGVAVMTSTTIIAGTLYSYVDAPWYGDLLDDQRLGGGIAWAAGELPLLLVVIALCMQWERQDRREARRTDRHIDSGMTDEFDLYNAMLDRLTHREGRSSSEHHPTPVRSAKAATEAVAIEAAAIDAAADDTPAAEEPAAGDLAPETTPPENPIPKRRPRSASPRKESIAWTHPVNTSN